VLIAGVVISGGVVALAPAVRKLTLPFKTANPSGTGDADTDVAALVLSEEVADVFVPVPVPLGNTSFRTVASPAFQAVKGLVLFAALLYLLFPLPEEPLASGQEIQPDIGDIACELTTLNLAEAAERAKAQADEVTAEIHCGIEKDQADFASMMEAHIEAILAIESIAVPAIVELDANETVGEFEANASGIEACINQANQHRVQEQALAQSLCERSEPWGGQPVDCVRKAAALK